MPRAPIFMVVVLVLGLLGSVSEAGNCPLYSSGDSSFPYQTPTSTPVFGYSSSCCTSAYASSVGNYTDSLTAFAVAKLTKPNGTCKSAIQAVAASLCSPSSSLWVTSHSYGKELALCPAFCKSLQAACASSTLTTTGTSVASVDSELLCVSLFTPDSTWRPSVPSFSGGQHPSCFASGAGTCSSADYTGVYTACSSQVRSVVYSWKDSSTCQGGDSLPAPITGLPCDLACPKGSYLPLGARACSLCEPGTFSFGGGVRINTWKVWPDVTAFTLSTYCLANNNGTVFATGFDKACGWQTGDTQITSGDVSDSQSSVLELRTYVSSTGAIEFSYLVDSEPGWDGLRFYVDGVLQLEALYANPEWKIFRIALAPGAHVASFHYSKDSSFSVGQDNVAIGYIQVEGTDLSSSSCTPCPAGTHSDSGAINCSYCPSNTYSALQSAVCTDCPASDYSFQGSSSCQARPACLASDYEAVFSACTAGVDGLPTRSMSSQWIQPQICIPTNVTLPATVTGLACAPCNPGQYRNSTECVYCPAGRYSSSSGSASCTDCPVATAALRSLYYTYFDTMPAGFQTRCNGNGCSSGWRFLGPFADSGVGHSYPAESVLVVPLNLVSAGSLVVDFTFDCASSCSLSLRFTNQSSSFTIYGSTSSYSRSTSVKAGVQNAELVFTKTSAAWSSRTDRVKITAIKISSTATGGAVSCTPCAVGSSSSAGQDHCTLCPAGTYRDYTTSVCLPCSASSYSSVAGSTSCEECGHLVQSTADRTQCQLNNCTFTVAPGIVYDLSPLRRASNMWGPIEDQNGQIYYLNVCNRYHSNLTCFTSAGASIPSYACQITTAGVGKDLGHTTGYYALNGTLIDQGLILEFLHGTLSSSCGKERSTTVEFVCDPLAGEGYPAGIEPVEVRPCSYQFTWHSRYACPLCTDDDYYPQVSECVNGSQTRTWLPLNSPQLCVDDHYTVKAPETLACQADDTTCPPGQYLSTDALTLVKSCVAAPAGYYSEGGATSWTVFSPLPSVFEGNWLPGVHNALSGVGDTVMELRVNLVVAGNITFDYKVYETGTETATDGFAFSIDGTKKIPLTTSTNFRYTTFTMSTPLAVGAHVFRWSFKGGDAPSDTLRFKGALVRKVTVVGTSRAATYPSPCPAGSYTPSSGYSACLNCPQNTASAAGSSSCSSCIDTQHYALPGSAVCTQKAPCHEDDFSEFYTDCSSSTQLLSYVALQPQICRIDPTVFAPPTTATPVPCLDCPPGSHRNGDSCMKCALGTGHVAGQMECVAAPAGSYAMPVASYFIDDSFSTWPTGFSTYCSGLSCLSGGWRLKGDLGIDSGLQAPGEVDSVLDFSVSMLVDGSISFSYTVVGARVDGLEFFIDGVQQSLVYHPQAEERDVTADVSFPVPSGSHVLRWVYHQNHQLSTFSYVEMKDIEVVGSAAGACDSIELCDPGTYSDTSRQLSCLPCPEGKVSSGSGASSCNLCAGNTYQPSTGQTSCIECGSGTTPSTDRTKCVTNQCSFSFGNSTYNLSATDVTLRAYYTGVDLVYRMCDYIDTQQAPSCPEDVYVCGLDTTNGDSINLGSRLNVETFQSTDNSTGVHLSYTNGQLCQGGTYYSTEVYFSCYDDVQNSPIRRRITYDADSCQYTVTYSALAGCRVCESYDYATVKSDCADGLRVVSVERQTLCNGPATLSKQTISCSASYETPLWVFFGLVVGFAIIAGLLIFFIVRHRQVSVQYEVLVNEEQRRTTAAAQAQSHRDDLENHDLDDVTEE